MHPGVDDRAEIEVLGIVWTREPTKGLLGTQCGVHALGASEKPLF